MDKFEIIIQGYAFSEKDHYVASPSTVIIKSNGSTVLVDPGADPDLNEKLSKAGYKINDIDIVYISHYHPDHFLNIRMFPNHKIYDGGIVWDGNKEYEISGTIPGTNIEILSTPGHSPEHTSLIVNTDKGNVCVAQDVFWWEDGKQKDDSMEVLMELEDPFVSDIEALKESRKKVLEIADWIIPGHGKMFKNPRK